MDLPSFFWVRFPREKIRQPMPEDAPTGPSIRTMVEERRRAGKKRTLKAKGQEQEPLSPDASTSAFF